MLLFQAVTWKWSTMGQTQAHRSRERQTPVLRVKERYCNTSFSIITTKTWHYMSPLFIKSLLYSNSFPLSFFLLSCVCWCVRIHSRCKGAVQAGEPPGSVPAAIWRENQRVHLPPPPLFHQTPASHVTPHLSVRTRRLLQWVHSHFILRPSTALCFYGKELFSFWRLMLMSFTPDISVVDNVQMLSHGSADLILESCTDFWDGTDIYPLSGSDRCSIWSSLEGLTLCHTYNMPVIGPAFMLSCKIFFKLNIKS